MFKYIIHLGYPKTGSTYLQRKIFSQLIKSYAVITPEYNNCGINIKRLKLHVQQGEIKVDDKAKIGRYPLLLSHEGFLFDPMARFFEPDNRRPSFPVALEGLRDLCGNATDECIVIVIYLRRQDDLVHSLYAQSKTDVFNYQRGLGTLEGYIESVLSPISNASDAGYYYEFENTLDEIRAVFGSCPLHIRFFENLTSDPHAEVRFWAELLNKPLEYEPGWENVRSVGPAKKKAKRFSLAVPIVRLKQKVFPNIKFPNSMADRCGRLLQAISWGDSEIIEMTDTMRHFVRARFHAKNLELAKQLDAVPDYWFDM